MPFFCFVPGSGHSKTSRVRSLQPTPPVSWSVVRYDGSGDDVVFQAEWVGEYKMAQVRVDGLDGDTEYRYRLWVRSGGVDDIPGDAIEGRFRTSVGIGRVHSFSFGFASCADNSSNSRIFDVIRERKPLFFMHTGDLHYGNVKENDPAVFHAMYDQVMSNPRQAEFFRMTPVAYMWDDHDFGPNNSHEGSPGRESSIRAFLETVAHYPLPGYRGIDRLKLPEKKPSVYFAFSIARVRFVVTDTSSSKVPGKTALGDAQLAWFKEEMLESSKTHQLIFWVSTIPWVTGHSKWGEFKAERNEIVAFLDKHGINKKLVMLSGDAHMVAVDDGSFSPGGFPVFQAASLDAKPTCKGGPYSHGIFPGRGQYGWIDVKDDGEMVCFVFHGMRVDALSGKEHELVRFDTCNPVNTSPRNVYYPSPDWIEIAWKWVKKKVIPELPRGDEIMVFFDGFTVSGGMVLWQYGLPVLVAIIVKLIFI
mmetsp:Transcript_9144/g.19779  ORF Transcript_9144/g.19779 Transcript_9144/m.19779 type:complete len:475 (-) Transcript_9144:60-1484(-)